MGDLMTRLPAILLVGSIGLVAQGSRGNLPAIETRSNEPTLQVGKWHVEFTNGVTEVCVIGRGGVAIVDEPLRRGRGRAEFSGNSVVLTFHDDRVERWTPVGQRFVVEHWFPGSQFPTAAPVLGIAERAPRGRSSNLPAPATDQGPPVMDSDATPASRESSGR
jgi:hypothetical protein